MRQYKLQFFIILGVWALLVLGTAFVLGPGLVERQKRLTDATLSARKNLAEQLAQEEALRLAQNSLQQLYTQVIPPAELLPTEPSLVERLATLEAWANALNIQFKAKLTGTINEAGRAESRTDIALVPATLTLRGLPAQIFSFLRLLEDSYFSLVTQKATLALDTDGRVGEVHLNLEGNVYIQR